MRFRPSIDLSARIMTLVDTYKISENRKNNCHKSREKLSSVSVIQLWLSNFSQLRKRLKFPKPGKC